MFATHDQGALCQSGNSGCAVIMYPPSGLQNMRGVHAGRSSDGQKGILGLLKQGSAINILLREMPEESAECRLLDSILRQVTRQHGSYFQACVQSAPLAWDKLVDGAGAVLTNRAISWADVPRSEYGFIQDRRVEKSMEDRAKAI